MRRFILVAAVLLTSVAAAGAAGGASASLTVETEQGPVLATVSLAPAEPRLGDLLTLTLEVVAEPGVIVGMPAFGDALGRFGIVDFQPREETTEDGGTRFSQRYAFLAGQSGRHRIPRLRVEFVDERPGRGDGVSRELLTDEIRFEVASVLPEDALASGLRPARGVLPELEGPWIEQNWPFLAVAPVILAAAAAGVAAWLRRAARRARLTAFQRAVRRLERLRAQGLPEADRVDPWYVELSDIVRRYIEERFTLRALELTTEEFLVEAGRSTELSSSHRALLSDFLERCDRVKFARYSPGAAESREALDVAVRFLNESRVEEAGGESPA